MEYIHLQTKYPSQDLIERTKKYKVYIKANHQFTKLLQQENFNHVYVIGRSTDKEVTKRILDPELNQFIEYKLPETIAKSRAKQENEYLVIKKWDKRATIIDFIGDENFYKYAAAVNYLIKNQDAALNLWDELKKTESALIQDNFEFKNDFEEAKQLITDQLIANFCSQQQFLEEKNQIVTKWKMYHEDLYEKYHVSAFYYSDSKILSEYKNCQRAALRAYSSEMAIPSITENKPIFKLQTTYREELNLGVQKFFIRRFKKDSCINSIQEEIINIILTKGLRDEHAHIMALLLNIKSSVFLYHGSGLEPLIACYAASRAYLNNFYNTMDLYYFEICKG
ncbi:hypothetical protein BH10PSE19_BH10PSE19_21270 [soil metagenome]